MEALQAVDKEEKRLRTKIENCQKNLNKYLDGLIEHVQTLRNDLAEGKRRLFTRARGFITLFYIIISPYIILIVVQILETNSIWRI